MPFDARVFNALIATPSDTEPYRVAIERTIADWNRTRAEREHALYLARHWSTDSVPETGDADGQTFLNAQLVDKTDVVFAVFHARLGRATPRGVSGTAEEITRAADAGKPTHVYFVEAALPFDHDPEQLAALRDFRTSLESRSLYRAVSSAADLEGQVRAALERDLDSLGGGTAAVAAAGGAALRISVEADRESYTDSKGKLRHRTRGHRLFIRNVGTALAESVALRIESREEGQEPVELLRPVEPNIAPYGDYTFPALVHMGSATHCRAFITWTENGQERSDTQDFTVH